MTGRPSIDIDRTGIIQADGGFDGRAYIAFAYSTNNDVEVMVTRNDLVNNALAPTWSAPVEVNPNLVGDQFHPQLAVDQVTGDVVVTNYTEDTNGGGMPFNNFSVFTTSARSPDGGVSWGNYFALSGISNQEGVFDNPFVDFGDYIGVAAYGGAAFFAWADNSTNPDDMDVFFNATHPPTKLGENGVITETIWEDELTLPWWDEDWFQFETNFDSLKQPNGLLIALDVIDQDGDGELDPSEYPDVELYWDNDGVHTLVSTTIDPDIHQAGDEYQVGPFMPIDLVNWTVVDNGLDPSDPGYQLVSKWLFDTSQVPPGQTYFLRIHGGSQMYSSEYDLHIKPTFHFEPDPWEPNDTPLAPTVIGSLPEVTKKGLTIHETGIGTTNDDWFKYTAHDTGKLILNSHFIADVAGGLGDLNMEVWADGDGGGLSNVDLIDNRTMLAVPGGDGIPDDMILLHQAVQVPHGEQIVMPVVGQEMYWIYVYSVVDPASGHQFPNCYSLELENFAAPEVNAVVLDPMSDTGMMDNDNVTNATMPMIILEADLQNFADMGITILDAAAAANNVNGPTVTAGAAVEVFVDGVSVGFANPIPDEFNNADPTNMTPDGIPDNGIWDLFKFTLDTTMLPINSVDGQYLVKGAVRIFDGRRVDTDPGAGVELTTVSGRTQLSEPLELRLDFTPPPRPGNLDLLESSDSGLSISDNMTNKMQPAFSGTGEANAKIRLIVARKDPLTGVDIGPCAVVGNDVIQTDGTWEITSEPLIDGFYNVYAISEDLAGNISEVSLNNLTTTVATLTPTPADNIPDDGTPLVSTLDTSGLQGVIDDVNVTVNIRTPGLAISRSDCGTSPATRPSCCWTTWTAALAPRTTSWRRSTTARPVRRPALLLPPRSPGLCCPKKHWQPSMD